MRRGEIEDRVEAEEEASLLLSGGEWEEEEEGPRKGEEEEKEWNREVEDEEGATMAAAERNGEDDSGRAEGGRAMACGAETVRVHLRSPTPWPFEEPGVATSSYSCEAPPTPTAAAAPAAAPTTDGLCNASARRVPCMDPEPTVGA